MLRNNWTDGEAFSHTDQNDVANEVNAKVDKVTLTTKGDLYVATSSGTITRVGVGTDNQVLMADSAQETGVRWGTVSNGTFADTAFVLQDGSDATKQVNFEVSGITTGTTRTLTFPDADTTLVGTTATQTLTNKTLSAGILSGTTTVPQSGTINLYNTADQTTDYERTTFRWNSNGAEIGNFYGGTGSSTRPLILGVTSGAGSNTISRGVVIQNQLPYVYFGVGGSGSASTAAAAALSRFGNPSAQLTATSNHQTVFSVAGNIGQSGTANYTGLLVDVTETSTGSGTKRLIDAQVGGSSKFNVDNAGMVTTGTGVTVPLSGTINVFNTADQVTNTERGVFQWASSRFEIASLASGTGTPRSLRIGAGTNNSTSPVRFLTISNTTPLFQFWPGTGSWTGDIVQIGNNANNTASSGVANYLTINPNLVQSGSAGYTCLLLNPLEGSVGTGNRRFIDCQMAGTSRLTIDVTGLLNTTGGLQVSGVAVPTISSTSTLTNKTIDGGSNTLSNIAQSSVTNLSTDLAGKEPTISSGTTGQYWRGDKSWATLDKSAVGLANVDNTSDASKPVSTATQTALDGKVSTTAVGAANGVASLDTNGKVPGSQLPNSIMTYEGLHDVSANSPALTDAGGDAGQVYRVSVAGSRNYGSGSITLGVGDYLIHSGSVWEKADTTDAVASVNGYTGNITLTQDDVASGTTNKVFTATEQTKLSGIATGATANSTDATLLDRTNHTGTQTASTISDFSTAADARITAAVGSTVQGYDADLAAFAAKTAPTGEVVGTTDTQTLSGKTISGSSNTLSNIGLSALSTTGTASGSTYLRGDGAWSTISNGTFADTAFTLQDDGDATRQAKFQLSGLTTETTRTYTVPDASTTLVGTDTTATLTNKTISGSSNTLSNVGLSSLSTTGTADNTTFLRGDGAWTELGSAQTSSFSTVIGNGTSTSITVTHNLHTRNVVVSVKKTSNYAEVDCDVTATTTNTVTLTFATAPTVNQYLVTVVGDGLVIPTVVAVLDGGTATGASEDVIDGGTA